MRAERKPVLLRGRDGSEVKRDFLMIALTHAAGLAETDQQRVLKGADPGPLARGSVWSAKWAGSNAPRPPSGWRARDAGVFLPT